MADKDNKDLYAILGTKKDANDDEIKKAYRIAARKYHPDINKEQGAVKQFEEIQEAYEILSDAKKRAIYDKYGMKGFKEPQDPFEHMRRMHQQQNAKSETVRQPLNVTLEDLYNGATRKIAVTRARICKQCKGIGASNPSAVKKCTTCDGLGVVQRLVQIAPGFVSQSRGPCSACQGQGEKIDKKHVCTSCNGMKVANEKNTLEVHIERGMKNNQRIVFEGEADERPDVEAGDIVFVLQEKPHSVFKREGNNLIMEHKITLCEALTGTEFKITHLDKRVLVVRNAPGEIIKPGQLKQITNEGMPIAGDPFHKGNLYIKFDVEFPATLSADAAQTIKSILPQGKKLEIKDDEKDKVYDVELSEAVIPTSKGGNSHEDVDDDDDEHAGHGRPMHCASQ